MMKKIRCRTCGKLVSSGLKRCPKCGTLLKMSVAGMIITAAIIAMVIAFVVYAIVY